MADRRPDGAREVAERALDRLPELEFPYGPFSAAYLHSHLALIKRLEGDHDGAPDARAGDEGGGRAARVRAVHRGGVIHEGLSRIRSGDPMALDELVESVTQWRELLAAEVWSAYFLTELAIAAGLRRSPHRGLRVAAGGPGRRDRHGRGVLHRRDAARARGAALRGRRRRRAGRPARGGGDGAAPGRRAVGAVRAARARAGRTVAAADHREAPGDRLDGLRIAVRSPSSGGGDGRARRGLAGEAGLTPPGRQPGLRGHRLRARLAPRRQGRERARRARAHRGARAARLARLLRQRVPADARGLRRADRPHRARSARSAAGATRSARPGRSGWTRRRRSHWLARFDGNDLEPGLAAAPSGPLSIATVVQRGLRLLLDFVGRQRGGARAGAGRGVHQRVARAAAGRRRRAIWPGPCARRRWRRSWPRPSRCTCCAGALPGVGSLGARRCWSSSSARARSSTPAWRVTPPRRRGRQLADMVIAMPARVRARRAARRPGGFAAIDHLDFREWLARHGAGRRRSTRRCVRGMYDLVFAYEDGDPDRPRFAPGSGCSWPRSCSSTTRARSSGRCGPGWATWCSRRSTRRCAARGVRFALRPPGRPAPSRAQGAWPRCRSSSIPDDGRGRCDARARAAVLPRAGGRARAEPLRVERLRRGRAGHGARRGAGGERRAAGGLAALAGDGRADVATVPTQALQVWLRAGEADVGWPHRGATVSGYARRSTPTRR